MARQFEEPHPALDLTDELPMLTAAAPQAMDLRDPVRLEPSDQLDHSIESLRVALDHAERRWRQLENRLEEQDRAIRALQDELRLSGNRRNDICHPATAPVPELTEIVAPGADPASEADSPPAEQHRNGTLVS